MSALPAPHRKTSRATERRKRKRQQQTSYVPANSDATPKVAPLSLDPRQKRSRTTAVAAAPQIDRATEYMYVRRDLVRLAIYSLACFALMIGVLLFLG
jgi:hypothetical protein